MGVCWVMLHRCGWNERLPRPCGARNDSFTSLRPRAQRGGKQSRLDSVKIASLRSQRFRSLRRAYALLAMTPSVSDCFVGRSPPRNDGTNAPLTEIDKLGIPQAVAGPF